MAAEDRPVAFDPTRRAFSLLGEFKQFAFKGNLRPDFTLSGEWQFVHIAQLVTRPRGPLVYQITFVNDSTGVEDMVLCRSIFDVFPLPADMGMIDFPARLLYPISDDAPVESPCPSVEGHTS